MTKKCSNLVIEVHPYAGSVDYKVVQDLVDLAKFLNRTVETKFNGHKMIAGPISSVEQVYHSFCLRREGIVND